MTTANYDRIMSWLAVYEGGKVDDPDDPGGRTNRGVTQRVYTAYRKAQGLPDRDVWLMNNDEHDDIYLEQYWRPIWGSRLPDGVDASMFDMAVHSGTSRSVKTAQEIVGVAADGIMGNVTLAAILNYCKTEGATKFCWEFNHRRLAFLKRLSTWWKYQNGWKRRVVGDEDGAQDFDFGVLDRSIMLCGTRRDIPLPKSSTPGKATGEMIGIIGIVLGIILGVIRSIFNKRRST